MPDHLACETPLRFSIARKNFCFSNVRFGGKRRVDLVALSAIELILFGRWATATPAKLLRSRRRLNFEPELPRFRHERGVLRLYPVGNGDMDVGFARPWLVLHGFDDRAGLHDVIESADEGLVVADILRADKSGVTSHRILGGARRQ